MVASSRSYVRQKIRYAYHDMDNHSVFQMELVLIIRLIIQINVR